jgi:hypothetical protein
MQFRLDHYGDPDDYEQEPLEERHVDTLVLVPQHSSASMLNQLPE